MTATDLQEEKEKGFGGCITAISLVGMMVYAGWLAPQEWRWFVFLVFTILCWVIEILNVQNKKKYGSN